MKLILLICLITFSLSDNTDLDQLKEIAQRLERLALLKTNKDIRFSTPILNTREEIIANINESLRLLEGPIPIGGGIHDHLYAYDRDKLISITFALEKYHRKVLKEEDLEGGLHDYFWRIPDDELRAYIIREVKEHPEIDDITKIEELAKEFEKKPEDFEISEGVKNYLIRANRENIINLALKLERYHRKKTGTEKFLGGLHDYIFYITDDDIRNYIYREIKENKEINDVNQLEKLLAGENDKNVNTPSIPQEPVSEPTRRPQEPVRSDEEPIRTHDEPSGSTEHIPIVPSRPIEPSHITPSSPSEHNPPVPSRPVEPTSNTPSRPVDPSHDEHKKPEEEINIHLKELMERLHKVNERKDLEYLIGRVNEKVNNKYVYLLQDLHTYTNEDLRNFILTIIKENPRINFDNTINEIIN